MTTARINILLPSHEVEISPEKNEHSTQSCLSHTYAINDNGHCFYHLGYLLLILANFPSESSQITNTTPNFLDHLVWLLDSIVEAFELQRIRQTTYPIYDAEYSPEELFFSAIQILLSNLRGFIIPIISSKGYSLFSLMCADILETRQKLSEKMQNSLAQAFHDLVPVCEDYDTVCRITTNHLIPVLKEVLNDSNANMVLSFDFKVSNFTA